MSELVVLGLAIEIFGIVADIADAGFFFSGTPLGICSTGFRT
jgi:hypothetical protein